MKFKDLIVNVINLTAIAGSTSTNSRRSLSHGTFGVDTTCKLFSKPLLVTLSNYNLAFIFFYS